MFTQFNLYVILISFILIVFSDALLEKLIHRKKNLLFTFLNHVIKVFICLSAIFIIGSQYEKFDSFLNTLISNSALMVAVLGFAFQQTIKNVLSGVMLLSSEAFKIGDRVRLPDHSLTGIIEELTIRHTTLRLATNERAIIPNSIMNDAIVINNNIVDSITSYPVVFPVKNSINFENAINIIIEEILNSEDILNKETTIPKIAHITSQESQLKFLVWTKNIETSFNAISDLKLRIISRFQKEKIY